jgi:Amt family ammonium transporter
VEEMMDLAQTKVALDTIWVVVTACLVFFMNAGFATLETGLCQSKNAVNILAKNFIVFAVASIAFYAVGFGLMFGDGTPLVGLTGWFLGGVDNSPATGEAYQGVFTALNWTGVPLLAKFFFQLVFAGTAATIVSGAVAERVKFLSFILFSFFLVAFIYPVGGHWAWGGGFLGAGGFKDFAGSTVVHSIGGWAALAGVAILGPRIGKYGKDGKINPIPAHNMGLATIGTLSASMAHEIKNPLVAIKTFAELLPERFQETDFREDFANSSFSIFTKAPTGMPNTVAMPVDSTFILYTLATTPCPVSWTKTLTINAIRVYATGNIGFSPGRRRFPCGPKSLANSLTATLDTILTMAPPINIIAAAVIIGMRYTFNLA